MAPKRKSKPKESALTRNICIIVARIHQIDVNFKRAKKDWIEWSEALRKAGDATAEIKRIVRRQHYMYRSFIQTHRAAPVLRKEQSPLSQDLLQNLTRWYSSVKVDIEDMIQQPCFIDQLIEIYDDSLYHPFLQAHREDPEYPAWPLNVGLADIECLLQELWEVADAAGSLAEELEDRYATLERDTIMSEKVRLWFATQESPDVKGGTSDGSSTEEENEPQSSSPTPNSAKSSVQMSIIPPSPADEASKHKRAATTQNYTTRSFPTGPPTFGSVVRRHGRSVPRIFTGSFSELEQSLRKLRLEEARSPAHQQQVGLRPFATSVSASFPATLAADGLSSEVVQDDAVEAGDADAVTMPSRRGAIRRIPNDRIRAQTLNDTSRALDTWLNERPTHPPSIDVHEDKS